MFPCVQYKLIVDNGQDFHSGSFVWSPSLAILSAKYYSACFRELIASVGVFLRYEIVS